MSPSAATALSAAILAAILTVVLDWFNRHRLPRFFRRNFTSFKLPATIGFTVLVADLDGEPECKRTNHLVEALGKMGGFHVRTAGVVLKCAPVAGTLAGAQSRLRDKAQALLREHRADVLVWGRHHETAFQLGIVPREGDVKTGDELAGYDITPDFTLPEELAGAVRDLLNLAILTSIRPTTEESGSFLVTWMRPLAPKLEASLKDAKTLPAEQARVAWHALGQAYAIIGGLTGDNKALEQAIDAFHKAVALTSREAQAGAWAMTQGNLAVALQTLGERKNSTARLEEAAGVYREILGLFAQEAALQGWAMTQNNLGSVLQTLGERESGTKRLEDAVLAFREALKQYTRERVPLNWAMAQNNLGTALARLGERENGTKQLEEAVQAFREALKEYTRERMPLDWAMTQNNLGTALHTLGERENGTKSLGKAVLAFHEALKERTRRRDPLKWAATQYNLGNVLWCFAEKTSDPAQAREALRHYEAALEVYSQAAPYYRALVEGNMRKVQTLIDKLEKKR